MGGSRALTGLTGTANMDALRTILLAACCAIAAPSVGTAGGAPFPLGLYVGNPNGSDPNAEAQFEANFSSFVADLKTRPHSILTYVDYTQPVSAWPNNASWQAWSNSLSPDAKTLRPIIGLPMASIASGSPSADAQFQAFAAGQYDTEIQGVLQAWVSHGFKSLVFRPGWEMNIQGPTYAGGDAQSWADWVAAFQHIARVLRQSAKTAGVSATIVWNPNVTNWSAAEATTSLYPGDQFADVIGIDNYGDMYPYSDGGTPPTYHDWDTGGEDTSIAQFIADPINRAHYWTWPAANKWTLDASQGHSQTFASLVAFAQLHRKAIAICETGAGNSSNGTDVQDDPTFPQWLSAQLLAARAASVPVRFVDIWDSNGGGSYEFSHSSDDKPQEAAAWEVYFGK